MYQTSLLIRLQGCTDKKAGGSSEHDCVVQTEGSADVPAPQHGIMMVTVGTTLSQHISHTVHLILTQERMCVIIKRCGFTMYMQYPNTILIHEAGECVLRVYFLLTIIVIL